MDGQKQGSAGSLTFEEIAIACRNVGINLDCGGCASAFFTGFGGDPHDENCTRRSKMDDLRRLEKKLKSIKLQWAEQADSFRKQSYKTAPGAEFNGLSSLAAKFEGLSEGIDCVRNLIKKL